MTRKQALKFVEFVVDDTGNGRELGADPHAIVRGTGFKHASVLVGYSEPAPIFVAVHSYLDVCMPASVCTELAGDFLREIGIPVSSPDFILR